MSANFLIDKDGPVTTITFSRPERRNCLNQEIVLEFEHHLQDVRDDRECRVLIVTGQGATFCAGSERNCRA
jgi:enoyl-CoA hydratase/carnithine racemase